MGVVRGIPHTSHPKRGGVMKKIYIIITNVTKAWESHILVSFSHKIIFGANKKMIMLKKIALRTHENNLIILQLEKKKYGSMTV